MITPESVVGVSQSEREELSKISKHIILDTWVSSQTLISNFANCTSREKKVTITVLNSSMGRKINRNLNEAKSNQVLAHTTLNLAQTINLSCEGGSL